MYHFVAIVFIGFDFQLSVLISVFLGYDKVSQAWYAPIYIFD